MRVDVVVRGAEEAASLLERLGRRLEDGTPQLRKLVDLLVDAQLERFHGRGQRWRKLAKSTLRWHREHGAGTRPLILTGELMKSLTVRGARGQVVRVTPTSLSFGTRVWYARFHHRGEGVPRRTVVGLTRIQRKRVVYELRRLLVEDL
jgi:phage gpG-like protein